LIGDPAAGQVGITVNSTIISIFNAKTVSLISPKTTAVSKLNWVGKVNVVGKTSFKGKSTTTGKKVINGKTTINGYLTVNGGCKINGFLKFTGSIVGVTKKFDIPHPTKENHRLAHSCIEGPENGVYYR
jgi:hypothetical protein